MSLIRLLPSLNNLMQRISTNLFQQSSNFHSLTPTAQTISPGGLFNIATRNIIRVHFPRPSEKKRVVKHGIKTRLSTPGGRRILMRRILKGRFVYSH